jgi:hypothetical protein
MPVPQGAYPCPSRSQGPPIRVAVKQPVKHSNRSRFLSAKLSRTDPLDPMNASSKTDDGGPRSNCHTVRCDTSLPEQANTEFMLRSRSCRSNCGLPSGSCLPIDFAAILCQPINILPWFQFSDCNASLYKWN